MIEEYQLIRTCPGEKGLSLLSVINRLEHHPNLKTGVLIHDIMDHQFQARFNHLVCDEIVALFSFIDLEDILRALRSTAIMYGLISHLELSVPKEYPLQPEIVSRNLNHCKEITGYHLSELGDLPGIVVGESNDRIVLGYMLEGVKQFKIRWKTRSRYNRFKDVLQDELINPSKNRFDRLTIKIDHEQDRILFITPESTYVRPCKW